MSDAKSSSKLFAAVCSVSTPERSVALEIAPENTVTASERVSFGAIILTRKTFPRCGVLCHFLEKYKLRLLNSTEMDGKLRTPNGDITRRISDTWSTRSW